MKANWLYHVKIVHDFINSRKREKIIKFMKHEYGVHNKMPRSDIE